MSPGGFAVLAVRPERGEGPAGPRSCALTLTPRGPDDASRVRHTIAPTSAPQIFPVPVKTSLRYAASSSEPGGEPLRAEP